MSMEKFFDQDIEPKAECRNCEYFDGGGLTAEGIPVQEHGDCLSSMSPRLQTYATETCNRFFPCTIRWPDADHGD